MNDTFDSKDAAIAVAVGIVAVVKNIKSLLDTADKLDKNVIEPIMTTFDTLVSLFEDIKSKGKNQE